MVWASMSWPAPAVAPLYSIPLSEPFTLTKSNLIFCWPAASLGSMLAVSIFSSDLSDLSAARTPLTFVVGSHSLGLVLMPSILMDDIICLCCPCLISCCCPESKNWHLHASSKNHPLLSCSSFLNCPLHGLACIGACRELSGGHSLSNHTMRFAGLAQVLANRVLKY